MMRDVVSFSLSAGELTVRDEAGGGMVVVDVDDSASLTPATDAWFDVPVDDAVSLETSAIEFRQGTSVEIRGEEGEHYGSVNGEFTADSGTFIDITAVVKLLAYVEGAAMTGRLVGDEQSPQSLLVEFDEPTQVVVGARSFHEEPTATMTVPDDPEALMEAASYLGSSIKEWSAERSWPTLRGHPPAIEVGAERRIPDGLSKPDPDVTVTVPPDIASVLRVTPLAHYFGADVVPGDRAELHIGSQHVEPLGAGADLEQSVDDLLVHALVLDSLVRIGGYYSLPRYEYDELAPELPFYPPELYDEPIHRQLLEYLEVSYGTVAPYAPDWPAVGWLRPRAEDAAAVPYLSSTLSRIHVAEDGVPRRPSTLGKPIDLSTSPSVPRNAAALPPAARERANAHERQPSDGASVLVVGWEPPDSDAFAATDWDRFELGDSDPSATYRPSVTRDELRTLLAEPYAHVHYGNRVSEDGFVCSDGVLAFDDFPASTVGSLSFQWRRSSIAPLAGVLDAASVATLTDESLPLETVQQFAVYLIVGRSVATSARLAGIEGVRFLGDATLAAVRRPIGHSPFIYHIEQVGPDEYRLAGQFDTDETDTLGEIAQSRFDASADHYQLAGTQETIPETYTEDELADIVTKDIIPRFEGDEESGGHPAPQSLTDLLPE